MGVTTIETLGTWLDAIKADNSFATSARKVIENKPDDAVDECWIAGSRANGVARIGATNICETTYSPHSLPVNQAGARKAASTSGPGPDRRSRPAPDARRGPASGTSGRTRG